MFLPTYLVATIPALFSLIGLGLADYNHSAVSRCCAILSYKFPDKILHPTSPGYNDSVNYNWAKQQIDIHPACVINAASTDDVSLAVKTLSALNVANQYQCKFAVRSGGHSFDGGSTLEGGVQIDLKGMRSITVSEDRKTTSIQPGAKWEEVYFKLDAMNLAVPGGRDAGVGVGGLSLGGGMSYFAPRVGFTCDNVKNYEIVLASGQIIDANESDHNDLLLALRGGGNNFGVITRVDIATFDQGKMWGGGIFYNISTASQHIKAFYNLNGNPDYDPYAAVIQSFGYAPGLGLGVGNNYEYTKPEANPPVLSEFLAVKPELSNSERISNLTDITIEQAAFSPPGVRQLMATTTFKNDLNMLNKAFEMWNSSLESITPIQGIQYSWTNQAIPPAITSKTAELGGNSLGLDPADGPLVLCLVTASWSDPADDDVVNSVGQKLIEDVDAASKASGVFHSFKYLNYAAKWQDPIGGYGPENVAKLKAASKKYDPFRIFQKAVPGGFKLSNI